jgi:hypothetical protein
MKSCSEIGSPCLGPLAWKICSPGKPLIRIFVLAVARQTGIQLKKFGPKTLLLKTGEANRNPITEIRPETSSSQNFQQERPRERIESTGDVEFEKQSRRVGGLKHFHRLAYQHDIVLDYSLFDEGALICCDQIIQLWSETDREGFSEFLRCILV